MAVPLISPLPPEVDRPFWSVMIPTHNCAHFLRFTLESVLVQDPGPAHMQIAVVDDASTDEPEAVVQELGGGRVEFYHHPTPLGAPGNFNECVKLARGHWVHILHGDDAVRPGFYQRLKQAIQSHPQLVAAFSRSIFIDQHNHWIGLSDLDFPEAQVYPEFFAREVVSNRIWTPAIVVARRVYEAQGGFRPELCHCCDWDMWKRVALAGPVWFEPEPLALYRRHQSSDTSKLAKSASNIKDMRRAVLISASYLSPGQRPLLGKALAHVAEIALVSARQYLESGNFRPGLLHILEGLRAAPKLTTFANAGLTLLAWMARRIIPAPHRLVKT